MYSYWEKSTALAKADLLVVGAGFTGLSIAIEYKLQNKNQRVLIIERGTIPAGASTKNAGFACFGSISEVVDDLKKYSTDAVWNLVEQRYQGIEHWKNTFSDIDFELTGGTELFRDSELSLLEECRDQIDEINRAMRVVTGLKSTYFESTEHRHFRKISASISNSMEGMLHSGKLYYSLLKLAHSLEISVLNGIEAEEIIEEQNQIVLKTNTGLLQANRIVVANNAGAAKLIPTLDVAPARGQILVTSKIPNLPFHGTFHLNCGFYYFRNLGNRVLIGGGRHLDISGERTHEQVTTPAMMEHLKNIVQEYVLPDSPFKIEESWAGTMAFGMNNEKEPLIGALSDRIYYAVRFGGMGVALSPIKAKKLVDHYLS